jgi:TonB-linked SusC/RagA family outer membrane protein
MSISNLKAMLLALVCSFCSLAASAQTVSGNVKDDTGESLVGVTVSAKVDGKTVGAVTDQNGNYTISVPRGTLLTFSCLGYASQTVKAGSGQASIVMKSAQYSLDDVVVIGYGAVKKKDVLGSISSVKETDLKNRVSGNIVESMRGLTSGVKITSSGLPGSSPAMIIRGLGSLTNNEPLFIIDGAYAGNELGVNVEDIESIQVLKDASSAAIYGSRAANGVVIITTKKGHGNGLKVKFNSQVNVYWLPRYDLMDAATYKIYDDRAYEEAILQGVAGIHKLQNHYDADTDWQDECLQTGYKRNYNVSFSGGAKDISYYVSLNRDIDGGALINTHYDKWGARINTTGKKGIFTFGENFFFTRSKKKNITGYGNNPWANFISMPPTIPVYDSSHPGGYGYGDADRANTYALNPVAQQQINLSDNPENILIGNAYGQLDLFKMITAKLNVAYKYYDGTTNGLRRKGNWTMGQGDDRASLSYSNANFRDILIEQTYEFNKKFGEHAVNAVFGISLDKYRQDYRWITKLDPLMVGDEYIRSMDAATGTTTAGSSYQRSALISYFGRLNYSYADRYLFQFTMRRDGTSRLPKDDRWGNFCSASLGWRISSEPWFKVSFIDDLKLRANYGTLGNSSIGYWDYQATINTAPRAVLGSQDVAAIGMTQSNLVNTNLKWERKTTTNVGFDLTALGNRLTLSAEYYYSKSKDLLVYLPILMSSGNEGGAPAVNAGSLSNRGWELTVGWQDHVGEFHYNASLNLSHVKNKIEDLGYGQTVHYTSLAKSEIGQPLGMFYLYRMLGIFQSTDEINSYVNADGKVIQPNALPGDIKYKDVNGDGQISSEDREICGNPWPKLEMGLTLGASWRGFDLSVNGYGRFGQKVYNGAKATAGDFQSNQNNFNGFKPWTQEHPVTDQPRIVFGDSRNSRADQDRWLESGSFFRVSDITLGYTVPKSLLRAISFEEVRFAVTLRNLITITGYDGLDPEFADSGIFQMGVDNCSFPNPRSVEFALSFTF